MRGTSTRLYGGTHGLGHFPPRKVAGTAAVAEKTGEAKGRVFLGATERENALPRQLILMEQLDREPIS